MKHIEPSSIVTVATGVGAGDRMVGIHFPPTDRSLNSTGPTRDRRRGVNQGVYDICGAEGGVGGSEKGENDSWRSGGRPAREENDLRVWRRISPVVTNCALVCVRCTMTVEHDGCMPKHVPRDISRLQCSANAPGVCANSRGPRTSYDSHLVHPLRHFASFAISPLSRRAYSSFERLF